MAFANTGNLGPGSSLNQPASIGEVAEVYAEMFDLLEDYAPAWYTEELHARAIVSLEALKKLTDIPAGANRRPSS